VLTLFGAGSFNGGRWVNDVSSEPRGRPAAEARGDRVRAGASFNGLPILSIEPDLGRF
jgi:hypothetical protein